MGREVEELNGIQNESMLSTYTEKRLEDGEIGLVPDVSDAASPKESDAWSKPERKEYKIRVTDLEAKGTNRYHSGYVNP